MTTKHDTEPIEFVDALGAEFARVERTAAPAPARTRLVRRLRPAGLRGPAVAVGLMLLASGGVATATGTLPGFSSSTDGMTPIVRQASSDRSLNVGAYTKDGLLCMRIAEPDGSSDYSDTCANLDRAPYSDGDRSLGVMLQQIRPTGTTIAGVAALTSGTVQAVDNDGNELAEAPVEALAPDLSDDPGIGTFVMQLPAGQTAAHVVGHDAQGQVITTPELTASEPPS